jgi:hypothetical protein
MSSPPAPRAPHQAIERWRDRLRAWCDCDDHTEEPVIEMVCEILTEMDDAVEALLAEREQQRTEPSAAWWKKRSEWWQGQCERAETALRLVVGSTKAEGAALTIAEANARLRRVDTSNAVEDLAIAEQEPEL